MSPVALESFLKENAIVKNQQCVNKSTRNIIKACVPMHTFGHPCRIDEIKSICEKWNIALIEDAAESLGSYHKDKHTGTYGEIGVLSFNGNKIITAGGGGCIITDDDELAKRARHISTTAKIPHNWDYTHDMTGYNYRLPNINAALLNAQLEQIDNFCNNKRELAHMYNDFFSSKEIKFFSEPKDSKSNYWLNAIVLKNRFERDKFLEYTNNNGVMTRPIWTLMNELEMFKNAQCGDLKNAMWLQDRVVNIPSSVRLS